MHVLIAGSHGQVGQHITELLGQSEHDARGMVRNDTQVPTIEELGADAIVADLTQDVAHAVRGCDAIVFAAGSGGEDVWGVDRDGAINLIETAEEQGIDRFVMLSSTQTPLRTAPTRSMTTWSQRRKLTTDSVRAA